MIYLLSLFFAFNVNALPGTNFFHTNETQGYYLGLAVGKRFADRIQAAIQLDPYLPLVKNWLARDSEAAKYVAASIQWHKKNFASSYREIDGLAVGAQVSVDDLQLVNFESDLQLICGASCGGSLLSNKVAPSHCSDVLSISPALVAHNEDNDDYILRNGLSYFVQTPDWTSFCYAGQLCGNAFSVNRFGVGQTSNQLWPQRAQPPKSRFALFEGIATNYALRATLSTPTVASSAQFYENASFITGFSVNFVSKTAAVNVETAFDQSITTTITQPTGHFNVYEFLNVKCENDTSSEHRAARFAALQPMRDVNSMIDFLGDTVDKQYPVFRRRDATNTSTLVSFAFDGHLAMVWYYNPYNSSSSYSWLPTRSPVMPQSFVAVPLVRQATPYTCGVASTMSVYNYFTSIDIEEDNLASALGTTPSDGTSYHNMSSWLAAQGLQVAVQKNMTINQLALLTSQGTPIIVLIQGWTGLPEQTDWQNDWDDGHWNVVVAVDNEFVYVMDPSTLGHYAYIPRTEFDQRWHDVNGPGNYPNGEICVHLGIIVSLPNGNRYNPQRVAYEDK